MHSVLLCLGVEYLNKG